MSKSLGKSLNKYDYNSGLFKHEVEGITSSGIHSLATGTHFDAANVLIDNFGSAVGHMVGNVSEIVSNIGSGIKHSIENAFISQEELVPLYEKAPVDPLENLSFADELKDMEALNKDGNMKQTTKPLYNSKPDTKMEKTNSETNDNVNLALKNIKKSSSLNFKKLGPERFIRELYPFVYTASKETGLSLELMLAQAAQETGWGKSVLPTTNNYYNIKKGKDWDGPTYKLNAKEYNANNSIVYESSEFRKYSGMKESVNDRNKFLLNNKRYSTLFEKNIAGNYRLEAVKLRKAGYATDPRYDAKLIEILEGPTMSRALKNAKEYYGY